MVRLVGWLVITAFAIYGAYQFTKHHVVATKSD